MTNPGFCFFFSFHKNLGCLQKTRKTFHFFSTKTPKQKKKHVCEQGETSHDDDDDDDDDDDE